MLMTTGGPFDLVFGLPLHPLIVHVAVVLLPLGALGLLVAVAVRPWRRWLAWASVGFVLVGTLAALVAKLSGEALAERVGTPEPHEDYANALVWMAAALSVVALGWKLVEGARRRAEQPESMLSMLLGGVALAGSALVIIFSVLVGHSGATAVWSPIVGASESQESQEPSAEPSASADDESSASPSDEPSDEPSASPSDTDDAGISMSEVAEHNSSASCWAAIDGTVYDLTDWIAVHPGGPSHIEALCGTDATAAFEAQHSGQDQPEDQLEQFAIGDVE